MLSHTPKYLLASSKNSHAVRPVPIPPRTLYVRIYTVAGQEKKALPGFELLQQKQLQTSKTTVLTTITVDGEG